MEATAPCASAGTQLEVRPPLRPLTTSPWVRNSERTVLAMAWRHCTLHSHRSIPEVLSVLAVASKNNSEQFWFSVLVNKYGFSSTTVPLLEYILSSLHQELKIWPVYLLLYLLLYEWDLWNYFFWCHWPPEREPVQGAKKGLDLYVVFIMPYNCHLSTTKESCLCWIWHLLHHHCMHLLLWG